MCCAGIAAWSFTEGSLGDMLSAVSKDAGGTGRGYLWAKAMQYIDARPWLGTGYGAFWRIGNPQAQALWYRMGVPPGSGFNFHNEYLHWFVDLGVGGLLIVVGFMFAVVMRAYQAIINPRFSEQAFAIPLCFYAVPRTPIEVGIFGHFQVSVLLFPVIWIYLAPSPKVMTEHVPLIPFSNVPGNASRPAVARGPDRRGYPLRRFP
jgi:exopolysaccharide production protein ExoQ